MNIIQFGNKQINYEIVHSSRKKTVAIYVEPTIVTIRAPKRLSREKIRSLVEKKARWIFDKQERIIRERRLHPPKEFVSGESFPYLGRQYRLKVLRSVNRLSNTCHLISGRLQVEISKNLQEKDAGMAVKESLIEWYQEHAKKKIDERLPRIAHQLGRWPVSIQIKDQKTRWGSCSRSGIVRFNWKIIMASISVLDYIITHELCHLFYQNHSPEYWKKVQSIIPDYRKKRDWLRDHAFIMGNFA